MAEGVQEWDELREWRTFTFAGGPADGESTPIERCLLHGDWPAVEFIIADLGAMCLVHLYLKVDDAETAVYRYEGVRVMGDHEHGGASHG